MEAKGEVSEIFGFRVVTPHKAPTGIVLVGQLCPPWCQEHQNSVHSAAKIVGIGERHKK
jgi:hypothetical protein